jgi:phytoene dehydrogenase-like protein
MDITIPTLTDPSLAPRRARHVDIRSVRTVQIEIRLNSRRDEFEMSIKALSEYVPNLSSTIVARAVITPADLEQNTVWAAGTFCMANLRSTNSSRSVLCSDGHNTAPLSNRLSCGAGTHPGGGVTGASGANASREIARRKANGTESPVHPRAAGRLRLYGTGLPRSS